MTARDKDAGVQAAAAEAKASRQPAQVRRWRDVSYRQAQIQRVSELQGDR